MFKVNSIYSFYIKKFVLLLFVVFIFGCASSASNIAHQMAPGETCARVSVFYSPPFADQQTFSASIIDINGTEIINENRSFKLAPGTHNITLMHHISRSDLVVPQLRRMTQNRKTIEVIVKPNTTYHFAALLDESVENKDRNQDFWQPIIWKETNNDCVV